MNVICIDMNVMYTSHSYIRQLVHYTKQYTWLYIALHYIHANIIYPLCTVLSNMCIHTYLCIIKFIHSLDICVHIYVYIYRYTQVHIHMYMFICTCSYVYVCIYIVLFIYYTSKYLHVHSCTCLIAYLHGRTSIALRCDPWKFRTALRRRASKVKQKKCGFHHPKWCQYDTYIIYIYIYIYVQIYCD